MTDPDRLRPPPFNPGYGDPGRTPTSPSFHPSIAFHHPSDLPPPPPERRCRSLPRRVHRPPNPPIDKYIDSPSRRDQYDPTANHKAAFSPAPIGFEAIASVSHRQSRNRARLPMSTEEQAASYDPRPVIDLRRCSESNKPIAAPRTTVVVSPNIAPYPTARQGLPGEPLPPPVRSSIPRARSRNRLDIPAASPPLGGQFASSGYSSRSSIPGVSTPQRCSQGSVSSAQSVFNPATPRASLVAEKLDSSLSFLHRFSVPGWQCPRVLDAARSGSNLLVVDTQAMTVHVCRPSGHLLSSFKVIGVQGGCFWTLEKLAIATHRGLCIYTINGSLIHEVPLGHTIGARPIGHGFVAVQQRGLVLFAGADCVQTGSITRLRKRSIFRRHAAFVEIVDVAVTSRQMIAVLDAGADVVYVVDSTGKIHHKIKPAKMPCRSLSKAFALSVDRYDNVVLADSGNRRVMQFLANGSYMSTLISFGDVERGKMGGDGRGDESTTVYGVAINAEGHLIVIVSGDFNREVRVYRF